MFCDCNCGSTIDAFKVRLLRKAPLSSRASTTSTDCPLRDSTCASRRLLTPSVIVERITWLQNRPKSDQFVQFFPQRVVASDVQATARPSPYCQDASNGSS